MSPRRVENAGPLAGHVRQGRRRYSPELAATGLLGLQDWVRDDLPDLIWPLLVLGHDGLSAAHRFEKRQEAVQSSLASTVESKIMGECLDGRLTGIDRLVARYPDARQSIVEEAHNFKLLPDPVIDVLQTFPGRPADWLTGGNEARPPTEAEIQLLGQAVFDVLTDDHREALLKCLLIWSLVQAGTFSSDQQTIDLLKFYPTDRSTRDQADSVVRATWGAMRGVQLHHDASYFDETIEWAKIFWATNSTTTSCLRRRDVEVEPDDPIEGAADRADADESDPKDSMHLQRVAEDLLSSYAEALETAPAHRYQPEPQEVHTGLVNRAGRSVIGILGYPELWSLEHGAHVTRMLVEVRILLQWMGTQETTIYRRFQEYGFGKAKLYARILDETPAAARPAGFEDAIDELERLSHNDPVIDHRGVDTSDSFAGVSLRAMAESCGLLELYRHAYYMTSGVTHSEWWSVEAHAMERCLNVLHRGHLVASSSMSNGGNQQLAATWVDLLCTLIRQSLRTLGTAPFAVDHAFKWLDDAGDQVDCKSG